MKIFFSFIFLCLISMAHGQKIEKFFNYKNKECVAESARFYSVRIKTDSGWHREDYFFQDLTLQLRGTYEDSSFKIPNGQFLTAYSNRKIKQKGKYVHGKKEWNWISFHPNGIISDSTFYQSGVPIGYSLEWSDNGFLSDSTSYQSDGNISRITWFDNGILSSAGRYNNNWKEIGLWKYYHRNGTMASREVYENGKVIDRVYFNTEGLPQKDTINRDCLATFPGGWNALIKFLEKELQFPYGYRITNTDKVTILVLFSIDESGVLKIEDHIIPFKSQFDHEVDRVLKKSPLWIPTISHNRKIKSFVSLPVTFQN